MSEVVCKPLTLEDLEYFTKSLPQNILEREMVIVTGSDGLKEFQATMEREVRVLTAHTRVNELYIKTMLTEEQLENLQKMINSPDIENLVVVEEIIANWYDT